MLVLKQEMVSIDIPFSSGNAIFSFVDSCTVIAHQYVSETCHSKCSVLSNTILSECNKVTFEKKIVRDWRESSFEKKSLSILANVPTTKFAGTVAPLLRTNKIETQSTDIDFDVYGPYIPTYSFQDSFEGMLYSSTDWHARRLITDSISALLVKNVNHQLRENMFPTQQIPL